MREAVQRCSTAQTRGHFPQTIARQATKSERESIVEPASGGEVPIKGLGRRRSVQLVCQESGSNICQQERGNAIFLDNLGLQTRGSHKDPLLQVRLQPIDRDREENCQRSRNLALFLGTTFHLHILALSPHG